MDANWQNVTDPIFHWADKRPDAPAFIQPPEALSYGELAALVGKAAVYLDDSGIRAGERIAINLTNSIDHFILTLALLRLGVTTMEMPYSTQRPPTPELLAKHGIRSVFIEPVAAPIGSIPSIKLEAGWRDTIAQHRGDRRSSDDGNGIFAINLTSGTTGEPKASLTSHRRYFERMRIYAEMFADTGIFSADRPANFLLTASIGFSVYFRRMINHLFVGGSVTILPEFLYTIDLIKAVSAWDNALCFVSSATCRVLIAAAPPQGLLFPRLRALVAAGSFLYPEEKLAMLTRVSPNFYEDYGASGFGTVAVLTPGEMRARPASVGRPSSFIKVEVVDEAGRALPPGVTGRLRFQGTEGATAGEVDPIADERFDDGWFYPGDSGHLDQAGYIFLKGRAGETIRHNGAAIFASEVEAVIARHPAVVEVAVVGVPRATMGAMADEDLVALVVARGEIQHAALAQHCQNRLPPEQWPDWVFYAQTLPRTAGGKVDRAQVKAMVMDEMARRGGSAPPSAAP